MLKPECKSCMYLLKRGRDCWCNHPAVEEVHRAYMEQNRRSHRSVGFICLTDIINGGPKIKSSPKWCPKEAVNGSV